MKAGVGFCTKFDSCIQNSIKGCTTIIKRHTTSEEGLGLKIASPNVADPPVRPRSMSSDMPAGMMSRGTERDL